MHGCSRVLKGTLRALKMRLLFHCRCWIEISLGRLTFRNSIVHSRLLPQLNTNPQLITNPTSQNGILTLEQPPDHRSSHPTRFRNPARRNRQHRSGVLYHTPKGHSKHWLRESLDQPLSVRKIRLHLPVHGLANLHQSATGLLLRLRPKYQRSKSLGFGMCARVVDAVTVTAAGQATPFGIRKAECNVRPRVQCDECNVSHWHCAIGVAAIGDVSHCHCAMRIQMSGHAGEAMGRAVQHQVNGERLDCCLPRYEPAAMLCHSEQSARTMLCLDPTQCSHMQRTHTHTQCCVIQRTHTTRPLCTVRHGASVYERSRRREME